ncbi:MULTISPECIES: DUF1778 domain-containing protein [Thalassospira]|uniref:DUF1778 domain-containing protein n=2 Tax=Thalassospira TaxID=168934 RepID=A0A367WTY9_9PROT|nr:MULTISPECIES: DUF1778 domain-containing protein [Thalassospira]KZB53039.1 hypothetical protein AUP41_03110 [Thalassospira xiamenensis]RCK07170.1 hypothetical protein TH5_04325 [Thalassospira xianhensis MCCC 1A02616]RCK43912.1 hypothetical protein TH44_22940 [Thalassospira xiamenensis]
MNSAASEEQLTGRLSIRVCPDDERLIRRATKLSKAASISDYLIRSAVRQAKSDLADRTEFTLHPDAVEAFYAALDRPAAPTPALRTLFGKKTVFEQ